jgi:hypothetical protein
VLLTFRIGIVTTTTEEAVRRFRERIGETKGLDLEVGTAHKTKFKWLGPCKASMAE